MRKVTWSTHPSDEKRLSNAASNPTNKNETTNQGKKAKESLTQQITKNADPSIPPDTGEMAVQKSSVPASRRSSSKRRSTTAKRSSVKEIEKVMPETIQGAASVNEAARYRTYTLVQDPMRNHEQYLKTHYDRIRRIHAVHKKGTVDCGPPYSMGKYLSRFEVLQRWAKVNLDRANYTLFELFSTAESHYDVREWMRSYNMRRAAMDEKVKHAKIYPRNRQDHAKRHSLRPKARQAEEFYRSRRNGLN